MPPNLPLRNRPNPHQTQINHNSNNPNDPKHLPIIHPIIPKNNRENNPAQIPRSTRTPTHDAIGMRMHVRHEGEIRPVARFEEECHTGNETEHGGFVMGVCESYRDLKCPGDDGEGVQKGFLPPDARVRVQCVGYQTPRGAEGHVQQPKHSGPASRPRLPQRFEILEVVGAEDGVDGEFGAEGTEVVHGGHEGLEGEDDGHGFFEGRFLDDFAAGDVEHLLFADLGFAVVGDAAGGAFGVEDHLCVVVAGRGAGVGG